MGLVEIMTINLKVRAIKDCTDDQKQVIFKLDECGTVCNFVTFQHGEVHAVIIKEDMTIISVDIRKLKVCSTI